MNTLEVFQQFPEVLVDIIADYNYGLCCDLCKAELIYVDMKDPYSYKPLLAELLRESEIYVEHDIWYCESCLACYLYHIDCNNLTDYNYAQFSYNPIPLDNLIKLKVGSREITKFIHYYKLQEYFKKKPMPSQFIGQNIEYDTKYRNIIRGYIDDNAIHTLAVVYEHSGSYYNSILSDYGSNVIDTDTIINYNRTHKDDFKKYKYYVGDFDINYACTNILTLENSMDYVGQDDLEFKFKCRRCSEEKIYKI